MVFAELAPLLPDSRLQSVSLTEVWVNLLLPEQTDEAFNEAELVNTELSGQSVLYTDLNSRNEQEYQMNQDKSVAGESPLAESADICGAILSPNIPAHKSGNASVHGRSLGDIPENSLDAETESSVINSIASSRKSRNKDRSKPGENRLNNYYARCQGKKYEGRRVENRKYS